MIQTMPNVKIIPAVVKPIEKTNKYKQLRVAAYCRVSTEQEEQQNSYNVQIAYYTDLINRKKEWTLAGIFADEGISGTQAKKRPEFLKMIRMCKKQKIDLVITKSISRFARNTVDCLEYVRQLKDLGIGVLFEKENINIRVVDVHTIKPIDRKMIIKCARETKKLITIEDHSIIGGLGTAVCEVLSEEYPTKVVRMGMQDRFGKSGKAEQLLKYFKLDSEAIIEKVKE